MVSPINSALSGLLAAGKRLEVSANNIANQFSTKTRIDGQPVDQPYTPQRVEQISQATGGVLTTVVSVNPATITVPDTNPTSDGTQELPNVDLEHELINMQLAKHSYKANLRAIDVFNNMMKSLLDIKT